jgi:hypothetical protein
MRGILISKTFFTPGGDCRTVAGRELPVTRRTVTVQARLRTREVSGSKGAYWGSRSCSAF